MSKKYEPIITLEEIYQAKIRLKDVAQKTPLLYSERLSSIYGANIYLKREDLQVVRSYKIRGAYNTICQASEEQLKNGIVCASAGNHAQGVAMACNKLKIYGRIFMPITTPLQKVNKVRLFGKEFVEIEFIGDTYDEAYNASLVYKAEKGAYYVHPFNDKSGMIGQGTVGLEILEEIKVPIDMLFLPIGGGGLASGVGSYFHLTSPNTQLIGVEPHGAPSMKTSISHQKNIKLNHIDPFVDGASVAKVGDLAFEICKNLLTDVTIVPEGKICSTILSLYNEDAIVAEPAGALAIAALDNYKEDIKGKNIVCILSGGNNDITRMEEIKERSLIFEGLKHYFIINFPQRAGALKEFVNDILGPKDDIVYFEYTKKTSRESGPAVVGIVLKNATDYAPLVSRLKQRNVQYQVLEEQPSLYSLLIK